jgi:hypothetical protein
MKRYKYKIQRSVGPYCDKIYICKVCGKKLTFTMLVPFVERYENDDCDTELIKSVENI